MPISDLIPWKKQETNLVNSEKRDGHEISGLQDELNEIFESVLAPWQDNNFPSKKFWPEIDIRENEKEITITADIPGMKAEDIDLKISADHLTISGEKTSQSAEKGERVFRKERSYGSFQRSFPLPAAVVEEKISADYLQGVLTIVLPKLAPSQQSRKSIPIKSA